MALVDKQKKTRVDVPHEPGEWLEFRLMTWGELELAERIRSDADNRASLEHVVGMDEAAMKKLGAVQKAGISALAQDGTKPASERYDRGTVLEASIAAWSYDDEVSRETVDRLDAKTAEWAFELAIAQNVRDPEQGKDSGPSSSATTSPLPGAAARPGPQI